MKIGEKIKRVRLHRHMKQRELGELVGFTDGAANRIAQYESGFRVPKEDMVKKIADALHIKECALLEPDTGNLGGIMETLFWLDEDMPDVLRFSLSSPIDKNQIAANAATAPVIQTNAKTSPFGAQPAMLWSENDLLNYRLSPLPPCKMPTTPGKFPATNILNGSCSGPMIRLCRFLLRQKKLKSY